MKIARILDYESHQKLTDRLFEALDDDPADPERYNRTSVAQVAKADQEIFRLLAKACKDGIAARPDASFPLAAALPGILASARIRQILQPLPKAKEKSEASAGSSNQSLASLAGKIASLQQTVQKGNKGGSSSSGAPKASSKSNGRGKGKPRGPRCLRSSSA